MSGSLFGKLEKRNIRFFIGSIEAGNGIEVTAFLEECVLKNVKFRCFGCQSLRTSTYSFLKDLVGKDISKIAIDCRRLRYIGCVCPKDIILCNLLGRNELLGEKDKVYLCGDILRYDVENMILLNNLLTVDEVKRAFNIDDNSNTLNLRLLKILKRVIEEYRMNCMEDKY